MPCSYDKLLVEWIGYSLNKNSLRSIISDIENGRKITSFNKSIESNKKYLGKILREEVIKQFNDDKRPILELILNSIDAKPSNYQGTYFINVKKRLLSTTIEDNGNGMPLLDIFRYLIIPFNTEKEGIEEIGRFGVGFFSALNYCFGGSRLILKTHSGKESYRLLFYAESDAIDSLHMVITKLKTRKKVGTKIVINKARWVLLEDYLKSNLHSFANYIAEIYYNKKILNEKKEWYSREVTLNIKGKEYKQSITLMVDLGRRKIDLLANGVSVKKVTTNYFGFSVSFPPAVRLVEGRDEFKIDDNYELCVDKVFECLEDYLKQIETNELRDKIIAHYKEMGEDSKKHIIEEGVRSFAATQLTELAASFGITELSRIKNIEKLKELLLAGKEYVLTESDFKRSHKFMSPYISKAFYVDPESYSFWQDDYKTYKSFLSDNSVFKPCLSKSEFSALGSLYNHLNILARQELKCNKYVLVEGPEDSESCYMYDNFTSTFYFNVNHRRIKDINTTNTIYLNLESALYSQERGHLYYGVSSMQSLLGRAL